MSIRVKGFTLVELMVTLAIGMILVSIAIPSFNSLYQAYRADSEIRKITQFLMFARSQAVSYGARVTICPLTGSTCGSDWENGFSVFIDNGTIATIDTSNGVTDLVIREMNAINSNDFLSFGANAISFTADGLVPDASSAGTFSYCPDSKTNEHSLGVVVSSSGKVRLVDAIVNCS